MQPGMKGGMLSVTIKDKSSLYAAYMPFVQNGGLFVPTTGTYKVGDEVFMLLSLMDEKEKHPIAGKVIWITHEGAQGGRSPGIGIQFSAEVGNDICGKIETYLAGALKSDRKTHTM